jgi:hypothetical protein
LHGQYLYLSFLRCEYSFKQRKIALYMIISV